MLSPNYHFPGGVGSVVDSDELGGCAEWREAFRAHCKDYRYYEILEKTLANDFEYQYLLLRDAAGIIRGIQPFFFVRQNLVEGVAGRTRRAVDAIRRCFPNFLTMRVLMVGCAAGEGQLGNIARTDADWVAKALHEILPKLARDAGVSLVVLKDFSAKYRNTLGTFSRNGFTRVPSMPMTRLPLHFHDFDDYLAHLSYATRKSLRRKFRKTERNAKIEFEVVPDLTPFLEQIYPLYLAVHERSPMKFEKLSKEYVSRLGREMPDRARFFLWRIEDRIVAFSICLLHEGTLYDEYLGLDYSVALDLHLYFYTLRDILTWAINNGVRLYCSSPLNYDPKLHLGCELAPLDLYVRHTRPLWNPIFGRVVKLLEPTRHDPVLRKFANAAEL